MNICLHDSWTFADEQNRDSFVSLGERQMESNRWN